MNLCDCYVTEVMGKPVLLYGRWWVRVRYDETYGFRGERSTTDIMLSSEKEAAEVAVGYCFLA